MSKSVDLTFKVIVVSVFLTLLLAISNTYLALKVGVITAASIPAAILSMGIMKFFRSSTLYEHNLVQTAASSGEAIAGGVGYTVPALILLGFWQDFNYWESACIALIGGIIGVLFSTVIRRPLLNDPTLSFPEGQAISQVLKLKEKNVLGFKEMLCGGGVAALIELAQSMGLLFSGGVKFFVKAKALFSFGIGLSPALIGAGYIVGIRVGLSLLLGAILSYGLILPVLSHGLLSSLSGVEIFNQNYALSMRYVGVGGMLCAAVITLGLLIKPLCHNVMETLSKVNRAHFLPLEDQDLSRKSIVWGLVICFFVLAFFFHFLFNFKALGFSPFSSALGLLMVLFFVLGVGFIMSIVCGYFSGLVGVSASPGSSVLIAVLILAALLIHAVFALTGLLASPTQILMGEAMTILIASVVMQIACIANDSMQDLKVGQVIGASPRKQQIMLIFGVLIASLVVPFVMHVLYQAYGIAGVMPHAGMDVSQSLAAPPAAIMAALTAAIFNGALPVSMLLIGAGTILLIALFQYFILKRFSWECSLIAVGIGMYLPLMSSTPLVIGAILSYMVARRCRHQSIPLQRKVLLACGIVAGATLMDVILAVPIALNASGQLPTFSLPLPFLIILSLLVMGGFFAFILFQRRAAHSSDEPS